MRHGLLVLALIGLVPPFATSQTSGAPLTIAAAVDLARANHPGSRSARAGAEAAAEEVGVAKTAYVPRLDLLWQANFGTRNNVYGLLLPQFVVPPVSGPVLPSTSLGGVWSRAAGVLLSWEVLSWEVIDFGRRSAAVDLAHAEAGVADAERRPTDLEVSSVAADAYLRVLASEAVLAAASANVRRLEAFAVSVHALVQNQLRAGSDLSRADAELAAALNAVAEAERDAQLARLTLAEAIGTPGAPVAVVASPAPPSPNGGPQTDAQAGAHPGVVASDARIDAVRSRDLALERTYRLRVELQTAVSGCSVSEHIDGTSAGSGCALDLPNWAVGVMVSFPALDGVVTERAAHVGSLVGPEKGPIVRRQQISPLRLVASVPEAQVGTIGAGQAIEFAVAAFPGETLSGRLARFARAVDPGTRTMAVEIDVENAAGRLAPGMFAEVRWPVRRAGTALFVPRSAVATTTERTFVARVRDGVVEWVDVKRGAVVGDLVEVIGPVAAGDEVALRATDGLRPGTRVRAARPTA